MNQRCISSGKDFCIAFAEEPPDYSEIRVQVQEFMNAAGQKVHNKPQVPNEKEIIMRFRLILEEVKELAFACGRYCTGDLIERAWHQIGEQDFDVDLEATADALADIDYVVEGMRLSFGINGAPIAREVHRANMAKFGTEVKIWSRTPKHLLSKGEKLGPWYYGASEGIAGPFGTRAEAEKHAHDAGYVFKREDGKHLKPKDWQPPDIAGELKKQGWEG